MSWQQKKFLTKQQQLQIPIRVHPAVSKQPKIVQLPKPPKNPKTIKMPIPQFDLDRMQDSQIDENQQMKISLGVQKQNSFLINSQFTSLPVRIQTTQCVQTQTDDYTQVNNLFAQPKIYQIPVEVEVEDFTDISDKEVQVSDILLTQFIQKLQKQRPAVLRQHRLEMNSAVISLNLANHSFVKNEIFDRKRNSLSSSNEHDNFRHGFEFEEEMLLESVPQSDNKQNLYKTANFETGFMQNQYTPQKSRLSGSESSPDTDGPMMRVSQREVNMMQNKQLMTSQIDEEQYQDLQGRFYLLQQQNVEKVEQIERLTKRIEDMGRQVNKLAVLGQQSQKQSKKYDELLALYNEKCLEVQQLTLNLSYFQNENKKMQQDYNNREQEIEELLMIKEKEYEYLEKQFEEYRERTIQGQEKCQKQAQELQNILQEKQVQINDLKLQFDRKYQLYSISIQEMKEKIAQYQLKMQRMQSTISVKQQKITQTKQQYQKLKDENYILYKRIETLKEQVSRSSSSQSSLIKPQLADKNQSSVIINNIIGNRLGKGMSSRQQQINGELSSKEVNQREQSRKIDNARCTVRQSDDRRSRVREESGIIMEDEAQQRNTHEQQQSSLIPAQSPQSSHHPSHSSSQLHPQHGNIIISQSPLQSKFANYSFQRNKSSLTLQPSPYPAQLEKLLLVYESIIQKQLQSITELQQKVLEFLKDALTKESQAELLYSQLCQYENNMNGMVVEKIDLELENQRLKKMIADSENKLAVLGNRLIKIAKNNSSLSKVSDPNASSTSSIQERVDLR